ncbi:MAG: YihY family inner membrane protein [Burkholderiaceae bacterium]|jgi:membrane protein|nr:YihY family inner membrane protein [Burkholderiaceae bacterium]
MNYFERLKAFISDVTDFPVLPTAATLWERLRQDRLGLTASALTFTTVLSLVPFFAVALSVFTAFPVFGRLRDALEHWLIDSLIPASIASNVMGYLTQFAAKASGLGALGLAVLLFTALSLVLTIDGTLNAIWRVGTQRPLAQRVLLYWAALTLGPLVLAASLAITSYVLTASRGWLPGMGGGMNLALGGAQFVLMTLGLTLLYRLVPNAPVQWRHALAGGLFAAAGLGLIRWGLGWYLSRMPGYSLIYGAFATVPILLLWLHLSWLMVLFGAVIAAYLPSLLRGVARRSNAPGWGFQLAIETLQHLAAARDTPARGLDTQTLAARLRVDALQLEPLLEALIALDWIGRIDESPAAGDARHVLLADPQNTPLAPLLRDLLLPQHATLRGVWAARPLSALRLQDVLEPEAAN